VTETWEFPASYGQERVWLTSQLDAGSPVFNLPCQLHSDVPTPPADMLAALAAVVARHEVLRTSLRLDGAALVQVVHASVPMDVETHDLRGLPPAEQRARTAEIELEVARRPIPLDRAPLWHAALVVLGDTDWAVTLVVHHAVFDAASLPVLTAELSELCLAAAEHREPKLPELAIQYADYASWQRSQAGAEQLAYWRERLAGLPVLHSVPTDRPRPPELSYTGDQVSFELPDGLLGQATGYGRERSATPFMVLLAAWVALLARRGGQDDVVVGVPTAGRDLPELAPLIGMFVNQLVLRVDASGDPAFGELVDRVKASVLGAMEHRQVPFQAVADAVAPPRRAGVQPLYQLGFNFLPDTSLEGIAHDTSQDDLELEVAMAAGRLRYRTDLYDRATAERLVGLYLDTLAAGLADPDTRLSTLVAAGDVRPVVVEPVPAGPAYVAPRTAAEELVAEIFAELLGVEKVGVHHDFFDLGGNSLLAIRAVMRIRDEVEVDIEVRGLFAHATVADLAAEVERLLAQQLDELSDDEVERQLAAGGGENR
jgi:acyl carrier protein